MNIKIVFLIAFSMVAEKGFAQSRDGYVCASDTAKVKMEAGLYILQQVGNKGGGLRVPNGDDYYCLEREHGMTLANIDSIHVTFDKYSKSFTLGFHFNKSGAEQLATFSRHYFGNDVGLFIPNRLVSAARMVSPMEGGQLEFQGGFTEEQAFRLKSEIEGMTKKQRR